MEYFLTNELDNKSLEDIKQIVCSIEHTKEIACAEYQDLIDNMSTEINAYYKERRRQPGNVVHETNEAISEFKSLPTYANQQRCNNLMNRWVKNKKAYEEQRGTWFACLRTMMEIEYKADLLPF